MLLVYVRKNATRPLFRCKSDASFAQARLQESELTLKLRNDQIKTLQKEIEKERQRGDFAEREATRFVVDVVVAQFTAEMYFVLKIFLSTLYGGHIRVYSYTNVSLILTSP